MLSDPVWKRPICGSRWQTDSEAYNWLGSGHPVLFSADEPGQQCWWPAAPRHCHNCTRHLEKQTPYCGKDQCRWNGDRAAANCADDSKSQVVMSHGMQNNKKRKTLVVLELFEFFSCQVNFIMFYMF